MRYKPVTLGDSEDAPFVANCLNCGKMMDGQMAVNHKKVIPRVGDASVCMYCQHVSVYSGPDDVDGRRQLATGFREPTEAELAVWITDPRVQTILYATGQVMKKNWKHTIIEENDEKES